MKSRFRFRPHLPTPVFAALLTTISVCCTTDPEPLLPDDHAGRTVTATFELSPEFGQQITVKADGSEDNPRISNCTVIQLATDGSRLLQLPVYISTFQKVEEKWLIKIPILAEESKIVVAANTGNNTNLQKLTLSSTESDVAAAVRGITSEADLTMNNGIVILSGAWTGTPDASAGIAATIGLSRAIAKVTLNLNADLPGGDTFVLQSVQVRQVPSVLAYYRDETKLGVYPYPDLTTRGTFDYPISKITDVSFAGGSLSDNVAFVWNLPENARGIGSAAEQKDKTGNTAPEGQKEYCTYVEIIGIYSLMNGSEEHGEYNTTYRLYLGGNNTNDYNLLRNRLYTANVTIRGKNTADLRIESQPYIEDLSAPNGTSNCYIVSKPQGRYKFNCTVMGNGRGCSYASGANGYTLSASALSPDAALLLWETGDAGSVIEPGSVKLSEDGTYILFKTSSTIGGNAVIAAMKEGAVIWSWHIWSTDYDPDTDYDTFTTRPIMYNADYNNITKRDGVMMKVNLGATVSSAGPLPGQLSAYGLLYQWGRKDPFIGSNTLQVSGSESSAFGNYTAKTINAAGYEWRVIRDVTAAGGSPNFRNSLDYVTAHPTHFINSVSGLYDWLYSTVTTTEQDNLWGNPVVNNRLRPNPKQGGKTMYDPCPPGWRVPPADTWTSFSSNGTSSGTLNVSGSFSTGWVFYTTMASVSTATSFYPAAGYRNCSDGKMTNPGITGNYFSSSNYNSASSHYASNMEFSSGAVRSIYLAFRSHAQSVRCIRE